MKIRRGRSSNRISGMDVLRKASLTTVELGGFTDIGSYAFGRQKSDICKIEDAQIIKASAFPEQRN